MGTCCGHILPGAMRNGRLPVHCGSASDLGFPNRETKARGETEPRAFTASLGLEPKAVAGDVSTLHQDQTCPCQRKAWGQRPERVRKANQRHWAHFQVWLCARCPPGGRGPSRLPSPSRRLPEAGLRGSHSGSGTRQATWPPRLPPPPDASLQGLCTGARACCRARGWRACPQETTQVLFQAPEMGWNPRSLETTSWVFFRPSARAPGRTHTLHPEGQLCLGTAKERCHFSSHRAESAPWQLAQPPAPILGPSAECLWLQGEGPQRRRPGCPR